MEETKPNFEDADAALVRNCMKGDMESFDRLTERYSGPVYFFVRMYVRDLVAAQDVAQDVFLKAYAGLSRLNPSRPFKPWLYAIARNTCIDYVRKNRIAAFSDLGDEAAEILEETVRDPSPLPEEITEQAEFSRAVSLALESLPPDQARIVLLHMREDLTFEQISELVGAPLNTVKSRFRRALPALRSRLERDGSVDAPK